MLAAGQGSQPGHRTLNVEGGILLHFRPLVAGLLAVAVLGVTAAGASAAKIPHSVLYTSTQPGVANLPSVGVEAYSFNQIGDEVRLRRIAKIKSVAVTLSSWACQTGAWNTGDCQTTPGATFSTPMTLHIYKASSTDTSSGETTPGRLLVAVTKTFKIPYRPSVSSFCSGGEWFKNGQGCFNGLAHTIAFTLTGLKTKLPRDVVYGISYNSDNSGPEPLHGTGAPEDSLNVGLAPKVRAGHQRYPGGLFWDTRVESFSCGSPFVAGDFNLDNAGGSCWTGDIPAVQFNATR
jgi:hypothetical protein